MTVIWRKRDQIEKLGTGVLAPDVSKFFHVSKIQVFVSILHDPIHRMDVCAAWKGQG